MKLKLNSSMSNFLGQRIVKESGLLILEPMNKDCKLAVILPVYNEGFEILLDCLVSLATQTAPPEQFEVISVVNNSQNEAMLNTASFVNNQNVLKLIDYINNKSIFKPIGVTAGQLRKIKVIQQYGLRLHSIDKSAIKSAEIENFVAKARQTGAREAERRFFSVLAKDNGIVVFNDCDSYFSNNYIAGLIKIYQAYNLNGLAGRNEFVMGRDCAYPEVLKRAVEISLGRPLSVKPKKLFYRQRRDNLTLRVMSCCPNISAPNVHRPSR